MAHSIIVTTMNESEKKVILHVVIQSDGSVGEIAASSIYNPNPNFLSLNVDPTMFNQGSVGTPTGYEPTRPDQNPGPINLPHKVSLTQMWYSAAWFDVIVQANGLVPTTLWVATRDAHNYHDFRYFGGIHDRTGVESDGQILLTTSGLDSNIGLNGTLIL